MPKFTLHGRSYNADNCVDGVLINPVLPKLFDYTPHDERPASQAKWWYRPYIVLEPTAIPPYDVRCLDGGCWDRTTWWGAFETLEEALAYAKDRARAEFF